MTKALRVWQMLWSGECVKEVAPTLANCTKSFKRDTGLGSSSLSYVWILLVLAGSCQAFFCIARYSDETFSLRRSSRATVTLVVLLHNGELLAGALLQRAS